MNHRTTQYSAILRESRVHGAFCRKPLTPIWQFKLTTLSIFSDSVCARRSWDVFWTFSVSRWRRERAASAKVQLVCWEVFFHTHTNTHTHSLWHLNSVHALFQFLYVFRANSWSMRRCVSSSMSLVLTYHFFVVIYVERPMYQHAC